MEDIEMSQACLFGRWSSEISMKLDKKGGLQDSWTDSFESEGDKVKIFTIRNHTILM